LFSRKSEKTAVQAHLRDTPIHLSYTVSKALPQLKSYLAAV